MFDRSSSYVNSVALATIVISIIQNFMIAEINHPKKNRIDKKIEKKDDRDFQPIKLSRPGKPFLLIVCQGRIMQTKKKKNQKIDHGKMKRLITYDRKSMIRSKTRFLNLN